MPENIHKREGAHHEDIVPLENESGAMEDLREMSDRYTGKNLGREIPENKTLSESELHTLFHDTQFNIEDHEVEGVDGFEISHDISEAPVDFDISSEIQGGLSRSELGDTFGVELHKKGYEKLPPKARKQLLDHFVGRYLGSQEKLVLANELSALAKQQERERKPKITSLEKLRRQERMMLALTSTLIAVLVSAAISRSETERTSAASSDVSETAPDNTIPEESYEKFDIQESQLEQSFEAAQTTGEFKNVIRNYIEQGKTREIDSAAFHAKLEFLQDKEKLESGNADEKIVSLDQLEVRDAIVKRNIQAERERFQKLSEVLPKDLTILEMLRNTPRYEPGRAQITDIEANGYGNCEARAKRIAALLETTYPDVEYKYIQTTDHIFVIWKDDHGMWRMSDTARPGLPEGDKNWIAPVTARDLEGFVMLDRDIFYQNFAEGDINAMAQAVPGTSQSVETNPVPEALIPEEETIAPRENNNNSPFRIALKNPPTRAFSSETPVPETVEDFEERMAAVETTHIEDFAIDNQEPPVAFVLRLSYDNSGVPEVQSMLEVDKEGNVAEVTEVPKDDEELAEIEFDEETVPVLDMGEESIDDADLSDGQDGEMLTSDGSFIIRYDTTQYAEAMGKETIEDLVEFTVVSQNKQTIDIEELVQQIGKNSNVKKIKIIGNIKNLDAFANIPNLKFVDLSKTNLFNNESLIKAATSLEAQGITIVYPE